MPDTDVDKLMNELLLERDEVARALRVPADTVLNLHRTKQLVAVRVGKHLRWKPADVRAYVDGLGDNGEVTR